MLSYNELKKGIVFVWGGEPYRVMESAFLRKQQRKPVMKTKIRNLISGKVLEHNFQMSDALEEADLKKTPIFFIFSRDDEYWFHKEGDKSKRFELSGELIGDQRRFLKSNEEVIALYFDDKIIGIELPIKMDFKVVEAPPSIKGNTAQGGVKLATLEGGAKVNVPLFVNIGDTVRINTQTGEYAERVMKG